MQPRFLRCNEALDQRRYAEGLSGLSDLVREASSPEELIVAARAASLALLHGLHRRLLRKATRHPACPPAGHIALAESYLNQGRFLEAEEHLTPRLPQWPHQADQVRALALTAISLAGRRRFQTAAQTIARAEALAGDADGQTQRDLRFARLSLAYFDDRWDEVEAELAALVAAGTDQARLYMLLATCREHLGRPDCALEALQAGCALLPEHPYLALSLSSLAWTLDRPEQAFAALDRVEALGASGRLCRAVAHLRKLYGRPAVRLAVPPVLQAHNHCFPACLTMVMSFWGRPADHREVGRSVMDRDRGTPLFRALQYLEGEGWACRTFRATPDRLRALVDRGVPAILGLEYAGGAHVHVCVGYDDEGLIVQDPMSTRRRRLPVAHFDLAYAHSDYWALAFTPPAAADRLADLPAADDAAIRQMEACWAALRTRDLAAADAVFGALAAEPPTAGLQLFRLRTWPRLGSRAEALTAAAALLEAFPAHREIRLEVAGHLERLGEEAQAVALVREEVGRLSAPALQILARAARSQGGEEAAVLFRKAAIADPQKAEPVAEWGRWEAHLGRLAQAEALFLAAGEMESSPAYAADLADLRTAQGRPAEAVNGLRQVLRQERRYPWAWWRRAEAHRALGQNRAAVRCLRIAMAQEPERELFVERLADLYDAMGRQDRALKLLRESPLLERTPDLQRALAAICLARSEWAEALAVAQSGMRTDPQDVRFPPIAAEALRKLGRAPDGRRLLADLVESQPDNAYGHARFGRFLLLEGEPADGVAHCRRALELAPDWQQPIDWVVAVVDRMADPRLALAFLEEQVGRRPDLLWNLAWGWRRTDGAAALRWAEQALVAERRSPGALAEFGHVALAVGMAEEAGNAFRGALDAGPLDRAYYGMALLAREAEKQPEQIDWMRKAVDAAGEPETVRRYADELGDLLEAQQNWTGLRRLMEGIEGRVPEAWRLTYLGYVAEMEKEAETALGLYEQALRLDPVATWPLYRRPQALLALDRKEEALALATAAAAEWPAENGLAWVAGRCCQAIGLREEAAAWYRRSLALQFDWNPPRHSLWELFAHEGWQVLQAQAEEFPAPRRARLFAYFGKAYNRADQKPKAWAAWEAATDLDPDFAEPYFKLAEAALDDGRPSMAWERAVAILARNPGEALSFAEWLMERTPPEIAATALERAAGRIGDEARTLRADVWWLAGECHHKLPNAEQRAAEAWQRAAADCPDHRGALWRLADFYSSRQHPEALFALLAAADETGSLPADIPGLLRRYLAAARRLDKPRRPHWRNLIVARIQEIARKGNSAPGEVDDLHEQYERLEVEFGNLRAAWHAWVAKDELVNWLRVWFLHLRCRMRRPPLDVRPGESTEPVINRPLSPWESWPLSTGQWIRRNPLTLVLLAIALVLPFVLDAKNPTPRPRTVAVAPVTPVEDSLPWLKMAVPLISFFTVVAARWGRRNS